MQLHIFHGYLLLSAAHKIRSVLSQTYSQLGNDVPIYKLRNMIYATKQGERILGNTFAELSGLGKN